MKGHEHLHILHGDRGAGRPGRVDVGECDQGCYGEHHGGEVAKHVLGADDGGMHLGLWRVAFPLEVMLGGFLDWVMLFPERGV